MFKRKTIIFLISLVYLVLCKNAFAFFPTLESPYLLQNIESFTLYKVGTGGNPSHKITLKSDGSMIAYAEYESKPTATGSPVVHTSLKRGYLLLEEDAKIMFHNDGDEAVEAKIISQNNGVTKLKINNSTYTVNAKIVRVKKSLLSNREINLHDLFYYMLKDQSFKKGLTKEYNSNKIPGASGSQSKSYRYSSESDFYYIVDKYLGETLLFIYYKDIVKKTTISVTGNPDSGANSIDIEPSNVVILDDINPTASIDPDTTDPSKVVLTATNISDGIGVGVKQCYWLIGDETTPKDNDKWTFSLTDNDLYPPESMSVTITDKNITNAKFVVIDHLGNSDTHLEEFQIDNVDPSFNLDIPNLSTSTKNAKAFGSIKLTAKNVIDSGSDIADSYWILNGNKQASGIHELELNPSESTTYKVKFYAIDKAGNSTTSDEYTIEIIVDTQKPTIKTPSFKEYRKVEGKLNAVFTWEAGSDTGGSELKSSTLFANNNSVNSSPGEYLIPFENSSKIYTLITKAEDNAGNKSDDILSTLVFKFPKELDFDNTVTISDVLTPSADNGVLSYAIDLPFTYGSGIKFNDLYSTYDTDGLSYKLNVKIGTEETEVDLPDLTTDNPNDTTSSYSYTYTPSGEHSVDGKIDFSIVTKKGTTILYTKPLLSRSFGKIGSNPSLNTSSNIEFTNIVPSFTLIDEYANNGITIDGLALQYRLLYKRPGENNFSPSKVYIKLDETNITLVDNVGNDIFTSSGTYSLKVASTYADQQKNGDDIFYSDIIDISYDIDPPNNPRITVSDEDILTNGPISVTISNLSDNGPAGLKEVKYWYQTEGKAASTPVLIDPILETVTIPSFAFPEVGNNERKNVTIFVQSTDELGYESAVTSKVITVDKESPKAENLSYIAGENSITFTWDKSDDQKEIKIGDGSWVSLEGNSKIIPVNTPNSLHTLIFKLRDDALNESDQFSIEGCTLNVHEATTNPIVKQVFRNNQRYLDIEFETTLEKIGRYKVSLIGGESETDLTLKSYSDGKATFSYPYSTKGETYSFTVKLANQKGDFNESEVFNLSKSTTNFNPQFPINGTYEPAGEYLKVDGSLVWPVATDYDTEDNDLIRYFVTVIPEGGNPITYPEESDPPLVNNFIALSDVLTPVNNKKYEWYVEAYDGTNYSTKSSTRSFTIDNNNPSIVKNETLTGIYTKELSFTITDIGSGVNNEKLEFTVNDDVFTNYSKSDNIYTLNLSSLDSGAYDIDISVEDNVGNPANDNINIVYDNVNPQIKVGSVQPNITIENNEYISSKNDISVKLEALDDYSGIEAIKYSFSTNSNETNHTWSDVDDIKKFKSRTEVYILGNIDVSYTGSNGESNYLYIKTIDKSGRESDVERCVNSIYFDITSPTYVSSSVTGFKDIDGKKYLTSLSDLKISQNFKDDEEALGIINYEYVLKHGNEPIILKNYGKSSFNSDITLVSGELYALIIKAKNKAGLETSEPIITFIYDNSSPINPEITLEDSFYTANEEMNIRLSAEHLGSGISSMEIFIGTTEGSKDLFNKTFTDVFDLEGNNYSKDVLYTIPKNTSNGTYYIKAIFKDIFGNEIDKSSVYLVKDDKKLKVSFNPSYTGVSSNNSFNWSFNKPEEIMSARYKVTGDSSWITVTDLNPDNEITFTNTLTHGKKVYVDMEVTTNDNTVFADTSKALIYDNTAYTETLSDEDSWPRFIKSGPFTIKWDIDDLESGISKISHKVEKRENETWKEILSWDDETQNKKEGSRSFDKLGLTHGDKIRITRKVTNGVHISQERPSPTITVDDTIPKELTNISPNSSYLKTSATPIIGWSGTETDVESGMDYYWVFQKELLPVSEINKDLWNPGDNTNQAVIDVEPLNEERWYFILIGVNGTGETTRGYIPIIFDDDAPEVLNITLRSNNHPSHIYYLTDDDIPGLKLEVNGYDSSGSGLSYDVDYGYNDDKGNYLLLSDETVFTNETGIFEITLEHFNIIKDSNKNIIFRAQIKDEAGNNSEEGDIKYIGRSLGTIYTTNPSIDEDTIDVSISYNILNVTWEGIPSNVAIKQYNLELKKANSIVDLGSQATLNNPQLNFDVSELSGSYILTIEAECKAGLKSTKIEVPIEIDTTKPEIKTFTPDEYVNEKLNVDLEITEDSRIPAYQYEIEYYDVDNNKVKIVNEVSTLIAKTCSLELNIKDILGADYTDLIDGDELKLIMSVKDSAGNRSVKSDKKTIIIDKSPADNVIISVPGFSKEENKVLDLKITATDTLSKFATMDLTLYKVVDEVETSEITITKPIVDDKGGNFVDEIFNFEDSTKDIVLLDNTDYRIGVVIENGVGLKNVEAKSNVFTVDLTPPTIEFPDGDLVFNNNDNEELDVSFTIFEKCFLELYLYKDDQLIEDMVNVYNITDLDEVVDLNNLIESGTYTYSFDEVIDKLDLSYGMYTIKAILTDVANNETHYSSRTLNNKDIKYNEPPIITFKNTDYKTTPGKPFQFLVDVTDNDGDGSQIEYSWTFSRGEIQDDTTPNSAIKEPKVTFYHSLLENSDELQTYTTHTIKLVATDDDDKITEETCTIIVENTSEGQLYANEVWRGIHFVNENIFIPEGKELTIEEKTEVKITGNYGIYVNTLLVDKVDEDGNTFKEIELEDVSDDLEITNGLLAIKTGSSLTSAEYYNGFWSGIVIADNGKAEITGSTISKADRGISVLDNGELDLTDSTLDGNTIGLHLFENTISSFTDSVIQNSLMYGVKEDGESSIDLTITDNNFINNLVDYYDSQRMIVPNNSNNTATTGDNE